MAKNTKAIKKRITSVKNTKKITKSMQLISAAKMQKSARLVQLSKRYTELGVEVLTALQNAVDIDHPLLEARKPKIELVIIISSNRGLCGNFNANVLAAAREYVAQWKELNQGNNHELRVVAVGKKSANFARKNQLPLTAFYEHMSDKPSFEAVAPIARTVLREFKDAEIDKATIIYTDYKSSLYQTVTVKTVLPITKELLLDQFAEDSEIGAADQTPKFEPNTSDLLNYLLPRMVESQVYQAVLESAASEHSSRMIAMKNATDSASDMIQGLTLEYNKSRQSAITQEMSEIIGGIDALSDAD